MSEWTKEPWPERYPHRRMTERGWCVSMPETDYARARACVNLLAGVEDIDKFLLSLSKQAETNNLATSLLDEQAATIRELREALAPFADWKHARELLARTAPAQEEKP